MNECVITSSAAASSVRPRLTSSSRRRSRCRWVAVRASLYHSHRLRDILPCSFFRSTLSLVDLVRPVDAQITSFEWDPTVADFYRVSCLPVAGDSAPGEHLATGGTETDDKGNSKQMAERRPPRTEMAMFAMPFENFEEIPCQMEHDDHPPDLDGSEFSAKWACFLESTDLLAIAAASKLHRTLAAQLLPSSLLTVDLIASGVDEAVSNSGGASDTRSIGDDHVFKGVPPISSDLPHADVEDGHNSHVSVVEPCTSGVGRVAVFGSVGTKSRGRSTDQVEKEPDSTYDGAFSLDVGFPGAVPLLATGVEAGAGEQPTAPLGAGEQPTAPQGAGEQPTAPGAWEQPTAPPGSDEASRNAVVVRHSCLKKEKNDNHTHGLRVEAERRLKASARVPKSVPRIRKIIDDFSLGMEVETAMLLMNADILTKILTDEAEFRSKISAFPSDRRKQKVLWLVDMVDEAVAGLLPLGMEILATMRA